MGTLSVSRRQFVVLMVRGYELLQWLTTDVAVLRSTRHADVSVCRITLKVDFLIWTKLTEKRRWSPWLSCRERAAVLKINCRCRSLFPSALKVSVNGMNYSVYKFTFQVPVTYLLTSSYLLTYLISAPFASLHSTTFRASRQRRDPFPGTKSKNPEMPDRVCRTT